MEIRKGTLSDVAKGIMTNKSEEEVAKIQQERVVRRTGTLEDSIANMYNTPKESGENSEKTEK